MKGISDEILLHYPNSLDLKFINKFYLSQNSNQRIEHPDLCLGHEVIIFEKDLKLHLLSGEYNMVMDTYLEYLNTLVWREDFNPYYQLFHPIIIICLNLVVDINMPPTVTTWNNVCCGIRKYLQKGWDILH